MSLSLKLTNLIIHITIQSQKSLTVFQFYFILFIVSYLFVLFICFQTLLGEFNKEQDAFIRNQAGAGGPVELPWAGRSDEAALKEECLSLSTVI